jgi:Dna[CI] antecedent DciA-like protein
MRPHSPSADSVKDLLSRAHPALARLSDQAARQALWRGWLARHLPRAIATHVAGVVERNDTLVIFTSSAAWSARLRFAVAEIEAELKRAHPGIAAVAVRVLPQALAT